MAGVEKEVRSLHAADKRREKAALPVREKKKAERVYNDEDHAEYSSEEEEKDDGFVMPQASKAKEIKSVDFNAIDKIEVHYMRHACMRVLLFLLWGPVTWPHPAMQFRKDFYVEVPEIREMTDDEVFNLRVALDNIRVKGKNAPKPIKNWAQAGLSQKVFALLKKLGYEKPMPIQAQTVPAIMSGRDVIGIAKVYCACNLPAPPSAPSR
jgi:ATP-dependent RNA helicase DDX46/PRP5